MLLTALTKCIKDCLTENDGSSYCPFRVSGAALAGSGIPTFIWGTVHTVIKTGTLDYVAFATGLGGMLTGFTVLCAGVALKAKTDTSSPTQGGQ
ncbi:hypothetical protein [Chromobacterium rhizoryzae]|uniref:Uncharacterized protein n=1 Tax=Chromobacterium rhizoryzae TaxID=1778675 RepID=A0AAD0RPI9_9NEIS|nr:hypothetical protein [Chromobacterium rhizoryzae]AXT46337.1 hypothetical protein D1345_09120 [Chromobacterium rhizoryzae]